MTKHIQIDGKLIDVEKSLFEITRADAESSLAEFVKQGWHVIEPGQPYVHGWHIDFICAHLEAITDGVELEGGDTYNRLLINVPPGAMKSLLTSVFWPAWWWGPRDEPHKRFLCASHSQSLAIRDSTKMRRLITSHWYQERWGDRVTLTGDQNAKTKFETTATGFREAVAAGSITGSRGDVVIIDDPHSVEGASSDAMRQSTIEWFTEAVPTRLNNPERSAIVVIMQRLHEEDVSGVIVNRKLGYDHIMLPMRYEPGRAKPTLLGVEDPREEEGELLFPARFPEKVVERDEAVMGPYAAAGQFQQNPEPRGGGIIKRAWWNRWDRPNYPPFSYVVAALDTAYTEKEENDPSAMTVWGVFAGGDQKAQITRSVNRHDEAMQMAERAYTAEHPKAMLIYAWTERLELHDLVEKVRETIGDYGVDHLLIEDRAAGHSVAQELRRIYGYDDFGVQLVNPGRADKVARLYAVQHLFADGLVYAPERTWAETVINQIAQFPKGKHDDLCLVAGTMIAMADGSERAIEKIKIGDLVSTPSGAAVVSAAGMTSAAARTWRVYFDGGEIEGTGAHPVMSEGKWMPLSCLPVGGMLERLHQKREQSSWHSKAKKALLSKVFSSTDTNTTAIPNQTIQPIGATLRGLVTAFIEMFGSITTGRFLMGIKSITSMETQQTTTYQTSNACLSGGIETSMQMDMLSAVGLKNKSLTSQKYAHPLPSGIGVKRGGDGTGSTLKGQSNVMERQSRSVKADMWGFVSGVALRLRRVLPEKLFVAMRAPAPSQGICLVKKVTPIHTLRPVYNLTVEGAHCYYANGVLVHNCDTTSMAMKYLRESGMIVRSSEHASELDSSRMLEDRTAPLYPI